MVALGIARQTTEEFDEEKQIPKVGSFLFSRKAQEVFEKADGDTERIYALSHLLQNYGMYDLAVIGYTGALKAPVRCFGNHLSEKRKSLFQTDNKCGGAAILKNRTSRMGTPVGC